MLKYYIEKYVNNMSISDIFEYAHKFKIKISEKEANILYYTIKDNWEVIVFNNHIPILNSIKDKISPELYNDLVNLIDEYKIKYSELLK